MPSLDGPSNIQINIKSFGRVSENVSIGILTTLKTRLVLHHLLPQLQAQHLHPNQALRVVTPSLVREKAKVIRVTITREHLTLNQAALVNIGIRIEGMMIGIMFQDLVIHGGLQFGTIQFGDMNR